ncbi:DUF6485 family protein [Pelosinus fermentans]|uniref:Cytosolic protein n=1 Tax=Pelosinus fermentans JBW45 TaxID=1192197 RepID=I9NRS6_9FIRM|nr:DUF6485 family protein [Pelosinus fermentans]AJQ26593.1 hypothetical protein JBW_01241 [Pelosinus fermentans JBW45]
MDFKKEANKSNCACTYLACPRRGDCYACVEHHRGNAELPGCFFTSESEKTYDRSIKNFIQTIADKE